MVECLLTLPLYPQVFELIDLYTPTIERDQYIRYMTRLMKAVTKEVDGQSALRYTWPRAKERKLSSTLLVKLRGDWDAEGEDAILGREARVARVEKTFASWVMVQREVDDDAPDDAVTRDNYEDTNSTSMLSGVEITLLGFAAAAGELLSIPAPPPDNQV